MATLKRKVYNENGVLTPIENITKVIKVQSGREAPELLHTILYNSDVNSENLYTLTKDLIENDLRIDHEKNAVNNLIDEGVLSVYDQLFEFDIYYDNALSRNIITIQRGNLKINVKHPSVGEINNIFTIYDETKLEINNISTLSYDWYRRDMIVFVFYDINNPERVPYIKHISGIETDIPEIPYTLNDRVFNADIGYYPLYQVLFKNIQGKTTYINHSKLYNTAGFKSVITLKGEMFHQYVDPNDNVIEGLYQIKRNKNIHLAKENGELLTVEYGQSGVSYEIDGGSHNIELQDIIVQAPDIGIQTSIADGGILNFPFQFILEPNQYFPRNNVELSSIEIAIQNFENVADWPQEGLELFVSTAKYYVSENNNGIAHLTGPVVNTQINGNAAWALPISIKLSELTQLTFDNKTFEKAATEVQAGVNGDFIFIVSGTGKYQISRILKKNNDQEIVINTLPFGIDETSKFIIFCTQTITLAGEDISPKPDGTDSDFYKNMSEKEKAEYEYIYHKTTNTAISRIHWNNTPEFVFSDIVLTPSILDNTKNVIKLPYPVKIDSQNNFYISSIYSVNDLNLPENERINYANYIDKNQSTDREIVIAHDLPLDLEQNHLQDVVITFTCIKESLKYFFEQPPIEKNRLYTIPEDIKPAVLSTKTLATGYDFRQANKASFYIALYDGINVICEREIFLTTNILNVSDLISTIETQLAENPSLLSFLAIENVGDLTIRITTNDNMYAGSKYKIILSGPLTQGYNNALPILGFSDGIYAGKDKFIGYVKVKFPFKLSVNYRQWYFVQPSIYDDAKPLVQYGKRPEVVTLNPNANKTEFNTYLKVICNTTPGLYPGTFKGKAIITLSDLYGDITNYSNARRNAYGNIKRPAKYVIQSRCLTEEFKDYRIPKHRSEDSDVAICYLDIINGLISFNPGNSSALNTLDNEIPDNLKITCSYNNVFDGTIEWSDIQNRPDDYGEIKETIIEAVFDKQNVFDLDFCPASKASINVDINGKVIPSSDFELIDEGKKILFLNYACQVGEIVHIKGNVSTRAIVVRNNSVTSNTIAPSAVISSKIANKAVTSEKLDDEIAINVLSPQTIKVAENKFIKFINNDDGTNEALSSFAILKYGPPTKEKIKILTTSAKLNLYSDLNKRHFSIFNTTGKKYNIYFNVLHGSETPDDVINENPAYGIEYSMYVDFLSYEKGHNAETTTFHNTWFSLNVKTSSGTKKYVIIFRANGLDSSFHPDAAAEEINVLYDFPSESNIYNGSKDDLLNKLYNKLTSFGVCPEINVSKFTNKLKIDYKFKGAVANPISCSNIYNINSVILLEGHDGYIVDNNNINVPVIIHELDDAITVAEKTKNALNNNSNFATDFVATNVFDTNELYIECKTVGETNNVINVNTGMEIYTYIQGLYAESNTNENIVNYGKFEIDQVFANTLVKTEKIVLQRIISKNDRISILDSNDNKLLEIKPLSAFTYESSFDDLTTLGGIKTRNIHTQNIFTTNTETLSIQIENIRLKQNVVIYDHSTYRDHTLGVLPFEYQALNGEIKEFGVLEISNGSTLISTAANAIASSSNGYSITFANPAYGLPGEPQFKTDTFYGKFIAHKIYNAVWNDIAEFMPSDGTTEAGDLVVVDVEYSDYGFRITKYNALKHSIGNVIGIHSQNPGMVLGWNANYQHPVEVALKGMVPLKLSYFVDIPKVGERIFLFKDGNVYSEMNFKDKIILEHPFNYKELGTVLEINQDTVKIFIK